MPTIARIIGGAGTGKTSRLLDIMAKTIEAGGIEPDQIGFCSFTRAARAEAATRAAERFDIPSSHLTDAGWFKTLHAMAYRILGVNGELLTDKKADRKWLEEALDESISPGSGGPDDDAIHSLAFETATETDVALRLWDAARNRLEPYQTTWSRAEACNDQIPPLDYCRQIVERYEQAKRLDGRCDFGDMLGRFAGRRFYFAGAETCDPDGDVPYIPVIFLDEQQDTSALLDAACRRLIEHSKWVYVCLDPYQAIYGWAGADARHAMGWEVAKQEIMPVSYRCPRAILELGEEVLKDCSDYWDRGIQPSGEGGEIESTIYRQELAEEIDPRESWLLLARSNYHAKRLARLLDARGVPWIPTRGNGGWNAPVTNGAIAALFNLERGAPIDGGEWQKIVKVLPAHLGGRKDEHRLMASGTKQRFEASGYDAAGEYPLVFPAELSQLGATDLLLETIRNRRWRELIEGADRYTSAVEQWGEDSVREPMVRVSTVHAAKGMEANNVLLLTTTSAPVARGMETNEGADEEARVRYVAVTRARKRLIVANERAQNRWELPL